MIENYSFVWLFGKVEKTAGAFKEGDRVPTGPMMPKMLVIILLDAIMSLLQKIVNLIVIQLVDGHILKLANCLISGLDYSCRLLLLLD